jgi:preprotein translocase subunit SecA
MDYLQEGIGLRAMAQRDPLVEYQREGYELFSAMMDAIKEELASLVFNVQVSVEGDGSAVKAAGISEKPENSAALQYTAADESGISTKGDVSRNSPCPCGSGKKYKRCHGGA